MPFMTNCTVADARECWSECVALLRQLFLQPDVRLRELDELALRDTPSDTDLTAVLRLVGTPIHVQRFLKRVSSPRWLWLLEGSSVLNTGGSELWWSAGSAAVRLADTHRGEVLCWLTGMHDRHGNVLERARAIAHTAYRLAGSALDVLLRIVRRYRDDGRVVLSGVEAALELDASDRMVEDLADVLMNEASWDCMIVAERLVSHLAGGVDEENGLRRIELLCFKLNTVSEHDRILTRFRYDRSGLIARRVPYIPSRPVFSALGRPDRGSSRCLGVGYLLLTYLPAPAAYRAFLKIVCERGSSPMRLAQLRTPS